MRQRPHPLERRMVHRLLSRWRDAQSGERPPSLERLYAQPLGDLLDYMVVVDLGDGTDARFMRLVGASFRTAGVADPTGRPVSAVSPDTLLGRAVAHLDEVVHRGVPITRGGSFTAADGRAVLYRSIILPICEEGARITHLVCAANGKVVPADAAADRRPAATDSAEH